MRWAAIIQGELLMEASRFVQWQLGRGALRAGLLLQHAGVHVRHALVVAGAYRRALQKSRDFRRLTAG